MGYSTEVVRRARERLAQARADRESENQAHLQHASITAMLQRPRPGVLILSFIAHMVTGTLPES